MSFIDRADAGRRLASQLLRYKDQRPVLLALPRGGVPVAAEIAAALAAPLDLILVRKIGVPFQPELAMGAVVDGDVPITVRNEDVIALASIDNKTFQAVRNRELAEIGRRRDRYLSGRGRAEIPRTTAIVVDDGIATGATTRAALRATRLRHPARLVLAVPVAPAETLAELRDAADEIVCLETPEDFGAIGIHYRRFPQVADEEVVALLARHPISWH